MSRQDSEPVEVRIETSGRATGRNGVWDITGLDADEWQGRVSLQAVGKRGTVIQSSGFHSIPAEKMDEFCAAWLKARGKDSGHA